MKGEIFRNTQGSRKLGYNAFDLSHSNRTSFNMGELIPTMKIDCVPGDRMKVNYQNMVRTIALASPAYVNLKVTQDTFFVPYRILWPNFEKFITGELEVNAPTARRINEVQKGQLGDYMGLPVDADNAHLLLEYSVLWFAAYYKIYDEYYRDQNLVPEKFIELIDGLNTSYHDLVLTTPCRRAWHHDYFTSALPFAQKGEIVTLPLLENGIATGRIDLDPDATTYPRAILGTTGLGVDGDIQSATNPLVGTFQISGGTNGPIRIDPNETLITEIDINAEAASITDLRRAMMLQEFLETLARVGTRYTEFVSGVFNTFTGDARLQRPEWIGRNVQQVNISEVLATAESTNVPVGNLAGHGISVGSSKEIDYKCKEHGVLMTLTSVQPTTSYHQGLHRDFTRTTWLDFFIPHFENIGEQEIKNKEIYLSTGSTSESVEETFGYTPRYSEYKYQNDIITGEMRDTLLYWNLSRDFSSPPALNQTFIECNPDHRIFAVTDPTEHKLIAHIYNSVTAIRPMQKYGSPKL